MQHRGSRIAKAQAAHALVGKGTPRSARSLQLHGAKKKPRFDTSGKYRGAYPRTGVKRNPVRFPVAKGSHEAGRGGETRGVSRSFL
jgi:hypothetical protein